jgi:hypothetical protein
LCAEEGSNKKNMRIRRGLSSRHLPCKCLAGIYETYRDEIVTIVDVRNPSCHDPSHVAGKIVPAQEYSEKEPLPQNVRRD